MKQTVFGSAPFIHPDMMKIFLGWWNPIGNSPNIILNPPSNGDTYLISEGPEKGSSITFWKKDNAWKKYTIIDSTLPDGILLIENDFDPSEIIQPPKGPENITICDNCGYENVSSKYKHSFINCLIRGSLMRDTPLKFIAVCIGAYLVGKGLYHICKEIINYVL